MELLESVLFIVSAIVLGSSMIVKGLAVITKITPTTKDDELVGKLEVAIHKFQKILDRLALNTQYEQIEETKKPTGKQ